MWEYKTIKLATTGFWAQGVLNEVELDAMLNEMGMQNWELVAAFDTNQGGGGTRDVVVIFKRPKQ